MHKKNSEWLGSSNAHNGLLRIDKEKTLSKADQHISMTAAFMDKSTSLFEQIKGFHLKVCLPVNCLVSFMKRSFIVPNAI